jgi:hypothetical protein
MRPGVWLIECELSQRDTAWSFGSRLRYSQSRLNIGQVSCRVRQPVADLRQTSNRLFGGRRH